MHTIREIAKQDIGMIYEWVKNNIISCRYIIPGHDTFRDIKLKTVAMMRKMLDPDGVCGVDIGDTVTYREQAKSCSLLFANVAGELICQWTEGDDNDEVYFPGNTLESVLKEISEPIGECGTGGLFERSDGNVNDPNATTEGTKAFTCIEPLPKDEVKALERD